MMKYIIKFCLYVTMVAFVYADIPVNFNKFKLKNSFSTDTPKTIDNKYPGQAMLYSAIVPGLGQLYNGNIKKALLFSIVEVSCWATYYVNNEQSKDKKIEYMKFADDEWSFKNWMTNYYNWQDDNDYKILFSNVQSSDTLYENIWDGSHHLEFYKTHNGNRILMSTTDSDDSNTDNPIFRDYYNNDFGTWVPDTVAINELINDPNFVFINDPKFPTLALYDIEGNVINVNSWLECANYVNGGWVNNLDVFINQEKILFFTILLLATAGVVLNKYYKYKLNSK